MIAQCGTEEHYKTMLEEIAAVTVMATFDAAGSKQTIYVSPQIELLLGYTQKEWMGNPAFWYAALHPAEKTRFDEEFGRTVFAGKGARSVYRFLHKDGRTLWILGDVRIQRDPVTGSPLSILATGVDVTALMVSETPKERT